MGHVKIWTDHHPQAILKHIWETSRNAEFFFVEKLPPCTAKTVFSEPKGPPLDKKNIFFQIAPNQFSIKANVLH